MGGCGFHFAMTLSFLELNINATVISYFLLTLTNIQDLLVHSKVTINKLVEARDDYRVSKVRSRSQRS